MADQCPNKNDIQVIFKRLRSYACNKACFDCNAKNPTWASVTYGVFICIDCSAVHRSLGVHLTFVRSTQLDTNWTWLQLRQMQLGGNSNALTFFRQHNCTTTDAQQKYNSRAAQLYREKLHSMAVQAMRVHGTKVHLDSGHEQHNTIDQKSESDFFDEHTNVILQDDFEEDFDDKMTQGSRLNADNNNTVGPDVSAALTVTNAESLVDRKPTIGGRKTVAKKSGLGGKKGGLGAQKVKTDFAEIEREIARADQQKVIAAEEARQAAERLAEEEEKQMASMRLAYQDLSVQQKKEEEKLKQVDPKKAQQMERLGMGFASRTGVSHSAMSDMKTIEQESPNKTSLSSKSIIDRDNDSFFDDYHFPSSGFGLFKSSSSDFRGYDSLYISENGSRDSYSSLGKSRSSYDPESKQPSSNNHSPSIDKSKRKEIVTTATNDEAQKKFGNAKAISSDQYFGDSADTVWERKANLSRFEGSSSISSSDYFGTGNDSNRYGGGGGGFSNSLQAPDLDDVKESVRQGVTKVAGKLSSIATGVMSSLQDRYGY